VVTPRLVLRDVREGMRYVWSWPGMVMLLGMAALINFLLNPAGMLLPLLYVWPRFEAVLNAWLYPKRVRMPETVRAIGEGLAIIPAIGYQYKRASAQVVILGGAGVMLSLGYDFWK